MAVIREQHAGPGLNGWCWRTHDLNLIGRLRLQNRHRCPRPGSSAARRRISLETRQLREVYGVGTLEVHEVQGRRPDCVRLRRVNAMWEMLSYPLLPVGPHRRGLWSRGHVWAGWGVYVLLKRVVFVGITLAQVGVDGRGGGALLVDVHPMLMALLTTLARRGLSVVHECRPARPAGKG